MDEAEWKRIIREATHEMYQLGLTFFGSMIPPIPENCTPIAAGPIRFDVEVRHLTDAAVDQTLGRESVGEDLLDDFGGCVHVFGAEDGQEHLRFDCFDDKPHYHYVDVKAGSNTVCRIDQFADGDPVVWTLERLRTRLPEMLRHAGSTELADKVEAHRDQVVAAVDQVETLLQQATEKARAQFSHA